MDGSGSKASPHAHAVTAARGSTIEIAAAVAPTAATGAATAYATPNRTENVPSCGNSPLAPRNAATNPGSASVLRPVPMTRRNSALPDATNRPAKNNHRETTSRAVGPDDAVSDGAGGGRPVPTAKAITPASVWPSSETIRQRTV